MACFFEASCIVFVNCVYRNSHVVYTGFDESAHSGMGRMKKSTIKHKDTCCKISDYHAI